MIYLTYFVFYSDKFYIDQFAAFIGNLFYFNAVHSQLRVIVHNFTAIF